MAGKPDYYYRQSAVISCQVRGQEIDILLVTSRRKSRWIIPGGVIEPNVSARKSAAMEALEEAGIRGDGTYRIRYFAALLMGYFFCQC